ncbi:MAG TPA: HAD family hydrolase [Candidatus Limiplasma sp.]|nr:HAD family hydrolase [Candidatus Limiplasma sp.]HPS81910.1 HAD family hydrolase [Candidatus Limiplasma sp.]
MSKTYALFDFDGTLIRGDSILLLVRYARRRNLLSASELPGILWAGVLYGLRLRTAVQSKERALSFLTGRSAAEVETLANEFFRDVLQPRLRPQGMEQIARHREQGHDVLLISASSTFYLEPLRAILGLTDIIGTRFDTDAMGTFTGRVCGDNCRGVQKALRLAEYLAAKGERLDYDTSTAYGDSYGDLPMLRLCAHKVGVNPKPRLWRALRTLDGAERVAWADPVEGQTVPDASAAAR